MPQNASSLSAEKPLQGAVLCCTSILAEERTQLAEYGQEMGAEHTLDLTSDVTHLIVGDTDSKKYQYVAKEREDVKVLRPEWIRAVREIWMADQPLNLNALDAEYQLPTLFGLKICITGFEDLAFRNGFAHDIQKNGGLYAGDLTKDVTHLIACTPSGKKYEYATMWQVKIVSVKWYKDSLDRGMQLDESFYHPTLSPEQQGVGAWNRKSPHSPKFGKRAKMEQPKAEINRKLRRTASTRFSSQHQDIWSDIVGQNGTESTTDQATEGAIKPTNPMLHSFSSDAVSGNLSKHVGSISKSTEAATNILCGKHFALKGFDEKRRELLFSALTGLHAHLHASVSELIRHAGIEPRNQFLVVPYATETKYSTLLEQRCPNVRLVTELWVEWCITMKKFVDPDIYFLGRPVSPIVLPAISKLAVNTTGFPPVQTMHISKLVSQLGAQYQEMFTPETSVLICNSNDVNPQKVVHAMAWSIPVVTEKWLEQLLKQERVPSFENYKILPNSKSTTIHEIAAEAPAATSKRAGTTKSTTPLAGVDGPVERLEDSFNISRDAQASPKDMPATEQRVENEDEPFPESHDGINQQSKTATIKAPPQVVPQQKTISRPLQELSPNIQAQQMPQPKKKMFRTLDGMQDKNEILPTKNLDLAVGVIADEDIENNNGGTTTTETGSQTLLDYEKHDILMKEFFEIKAAAARKTAEITRRSSSSRVKEKKLLGRALSNLSNSSRTSNDNGKDDTIRQRQSLSRASSIHSVITDGLGVPLSNISRLPSDPKPTNVHAPKTDGGRKFYESKELAPRQISDGVQPPGSNDVCQDVSALSSFHAQLLTFTNSQPIRAASPPPRSQDQGQLTYADTAEAVKLRAQLAEKRRARAKLDQPLDHQAPVLSKEESEERRQQEWRDMQRKMSGGGVLRDDEALIGGGRRTRGRDKALAGLEAAKNVDDEWGAGVLI